MLVNAGSKPVGLGRLTANCQRLTTRDLLGERREEPTSPTGLFCYKHRSSIAAQLATGKSRQQNWTLLFNITLLPAIPIAVKFLAIRRGLANCIVHWLRFSHLLPKLPAARRVQHDLRRACVGLTVLGGTFQHMIMWSYTRINDAKFLLAAVTESLTDTADRPIIYTRCKQLWHLLTRSSAIAGRPCDAKACQGLLKWT